MAERVEGHVRSAFEVVKDGGAYPAGTILEESPTWVVVKDPEEGIALVRRADLRIVGVD